MNIDDKVFEWDYAKDKLIPALIAPDKYKTILDATPHRSFVDVALIYRLDLGEVTVIVNDKMLDAYGVDENTLYSVALGNCKPKFDNLSTMIGLPDESPLWVGTVDSGRYGAACVLLPDFMQQVTERLGNKLFILPSSVHEVLFVPADGSFDAVTLGDMVRSINATEVDEKDFLSDSVYRYDNGEWSVVSVEPEFETGEDLDMLLGF